MPSNCSETEIEQGKVPAGENTKEERTSAGEKECAEKKLQLKLHISALSSPAMLLFLLSQFLIGLGIDASFSFSPDRALQVGGLSKAQISLLLSIIGVSNCVGRIFFGWLLDRSKPHHHGPFENFRFGPWTLQLTSMVALANTVTVLSGDLVTGFFIQLIEYANPPKSLKSS